MAAFRAAIDADVGIECDLRLSRDGFAMVFHDNSLDRLCGVNVEPESLHAAALMQFRLAGSGERIPWLGDLLALVDGRVPLLLELKRRSGAQSLSAPIAHLCRATRVALDGYRGPVAVISFDASVGNWFAAHAPSVRRGLVLDGSDKPLAANGQAVVEQGGPRRGQGGLDRGALGDRAAPLGTRHLLLDNPHRGRARDSGGSRRRAHLGSRWPTVNAN